VLLDGAARGRLGYERVVEVYSVAPARIYGLRGKGSLEPGADAEPAARPELDVTERVPFTSDSSLGRVLAELGVDPVHPDDLAAALGLDMATLAVALTTLQLRGAITDVCGGRVARTF